MADDDSNLVVGQDFQSKVELYFIGLTFAILGLSIQTASFGRNLFADGLELTGWLSLLVSGLTGLRRLDRVPSLYRLFSWHDRYSTRAQEIRKLEAKGIGTVVSLEDGLKHPTTEALENAVTSVQKLDSAIKNDSAMLARQFRLQRRSFALGIGLLVAGRAFIPAVRIILEIARAVRGAGA